MEQSKSKKYRKREQIARKEENQEKEGVSLSQFVEKLQKYITKMRNFENT